jgi:PUA domain protein
MKRHRLGKKETKELLEHISDTLGKKARKVTLQDRSLEVVDLSPTEKIFLLNEKPILIETGGQTIPALLNGSLLDLFPSVLVDMGAVPHVCNGADVMAPGIIRVEGEFVAGMLVVIRDERHHKAIAIGRSLYDSNQFRKKKHGRMVENLHFVGDDIWKKTEHAL